MVSSSPDSLVNKNNKITNKNKNKSINIDTHNINNTKEILSLPVHNKTPTKTKTMYPANHVKNENSDILTYKEVADGPTTPTTPTDAPMATMDQDDKPWTPVSLKPRNGRHTPVQSPVITPDSAIPTSNSFAALQDNENDSSPFVKPEMTTEKYTCTEQETTSTFSNNRNLKSDFQHEKIENRNIKTIKALLEQGNGDQCTIDELAN